MDNLTPKLPAGVRIAIDFPAWPSLTAGDLVDFLEGDDAPRASVCLDAGHAALGGSAVGLRGRSSPGFSPASGCTTITAAKTAIESRGRAPLTGPR
jgi:hypothetical protein